MSSSNSGDVPFWNRTRAEQKIYLENGIQYFFDGDRELSGRILFFLSDALDHIEYGRYGLAMQSIINAHADESIFSSEYKIPLIDGLTRDSLLERLIVSKNASPADRIYFC